MGYSICDAAMGIDDGRWNEQFLKIAQNKVSDAKKKYALSMNTKEKRPMEKELAGFYAHPAYGALEIISKGKGYNVKLASFTLYLQTHADVVSLYIAVRQVVNFKKNESLGLEKAMELALEAGDTKSVQKLKSLGEFPLAKLDEEGFKKIATLRQIQQKYGLAVGFDSKLVNAFI